MSVGGTAGGRIAPGVGANLIGQHAQDRNQDATIYVGNLDAQMSEEMVWELFVQAGPVVNVYLPKDRVTNLHQGYGFVEFQSEEDADYAIKTLNMIKVYGKPIRVNKASQDKKTLDVGANLFIGNLDPEVDEKLLYDTFSAFGMIVATPKIMRDPETGASRGFGFVSYESFEASDAAIEAMSGQFLCNRSITVSYAFKKDTKGERHGTPAERLLAEQQRTKAAAAQRPHTLFATGPAPKPGGGTAAPGSPRGPHPVPAASGFAASGTAPPPPPPGALPNGGGPPPPPPGMVAAPPPPWAQPPPGPTYSGAPGPAPGPSGPPPSFQPGPPGPGMQPGYGGPPPGPQPGFSAPPQAYQGPPPGYSGPPPPGAYGGPRPPQPMHGSGPQHPGGPPPWGQPPPGFRPMGLPPGHMGPPPPGFGGPGMPPPGFQGRPPPPWGQMPPPMR